MSRLPLSHSRIEMFEDCPYLFKRRALDKAEEVKSEPLMVGSFVHAWIEEYDKLCERTKQESDFAAGEVLFDTMWTGRASVKDYAGLRESLHDSTLAIVRTFLQSHTFPTDGRFAAREIQIALDERWKPVGWFAPEVFFRAKIDRLEVLEEDGGEATIGVIRDYKTGWNVDTVAEVAANPQLRRYIMAVEAYMQTDGRPVDGYSVSLDFVRWGVERVVPLDAEAGEAEKDRVLAVSDRVEKALKANRWPATPGNACDFCPVFSECPARATVVAQGLRAPQDSDEARQLMSRLILLEKDRKQIQEHLKAYGDAHGPVVENGMQYGPSKVKRLEYDYEKVMAWADYWGVNGPALAKIDNDALGKAIARLKKDRPESDIDSTLPVPIDKSGTEYRLKKAAASE